MSNILAFTIGASIIPTLISLFYIGYAYRNSGRPSDVPYEIIPVVVLFLFGIFNIINVRLNGKYSFLLGAALGLVFSIIGRFYLDLPTKIFGFTRENEYQVHITAMVLYSFIFGIVIQNLNNILNVYNN